jgi:hypothetical protein
VNLRSKLAIAFAGVGAAAAILVGVFSYQAASQRIDAELDRSLLTTSAEVAAGATQVLAPSPVTRGPDDDDHDETQPMPKSRRRSSWARWPSTPPSASGAGRDAPSASPPTPRR